MSATRILVAAYEPTGIDYDDSDQPTSHPERLEWRVRMWRCAKGDGGWRESGSQILKIQDTVAKDHIRNAPYAIALAAGIAAEMNSCENVWIVHPGGRQ